MTANNAYEYLRDNFGDPAYFVMHKNDQRLGQRFFNALNDNDQWLLRKAGLDPFYSDKREDVERAVEYLVDFGG